MASNTNMASYTGPAPYTYLPGGQRTEDMREIYLANFDLALAQRITPEFNPDGENHGGNKTLASYWQFIEGDGHQVPDRYQCIGCLKTAGKRLDIERHLIFKHFGIRWTCGWSGCNKTSINSYYLTGDHAKIHTGATTPCKYAGCDWSATDSSAILKHTRTCKHKPGNTNGTPLAPLSGSKTNARANTKQARKGRKAAVRSQKAKAQKANGILPEPTEGSSDNSDMMTSGPAVYENDGFSMGAQAPQQLYGGISAPTELQQNSSSYAYPGLNFDQPGDVFMGAATAQQHDGENLVHFRAAGTNALHAAPSNDLGAMSLIDNNFFAGSDYTGVNQDPLGSFDNNMDFNMSNNNMGTMLPSDNISAGFDNYGDDQALFGSQLSEIVAPFSSAEIDADFLGPVAQYNQSYTGGGNLDSANIDPALEGLGHSNVDPDVAAMGLSGPNFANNNGDNQRVFDPTDIDWERALNGPSQEQEDLDELFGGGC